MSKWMSFCWYLAMAGVLVGSIGGHFDYAACCIGLAILIDLNRSPRHD